MINGASACRISAVGVVACLVVIGGVVRHQIGAAASEHAERQRPESTPADGLEAHTTHPVGSSTSRRVEGWYDIRRGAAGYAPIIGAFGALAVPAIIVLFTVPPKPSTYLAPFITLAAGLLIVAMIGSFTGAIGMAAIGAERDPTANLVPATLLVAIPVVLSFVAVLGAFEVLASVYLPASKLLFALITAAGGLSGVFFMSFAVGDAWASGPTDVGEREVWLPTQWLRSQDQSYRQANFVAATSVVPVLTGVIVRVVGVKVVPSTLGVDWLLGAALALALVGGFWGIFRTQHASDGLQKGLRPYEAYTSTLAVSLYVLTLMIFLP